MSGWEAVGGTDFRGFFCGPGPEGLRVPGGQGAEPWLCTEAGTGLRVSDLCMWDGVTPPRQSPRRQEERLVLGAVNPPRSLASDLQSTSSDAPSCRVRGLFCGLFSVCLCMSSPGRVSSLPRATEWVPLRRQGPWESKGRARWHLHPLLTRCQPASQRTGLIINVPASSLTKQKANTQGRERVTGRQQ